MPHQEFVSGDVAMPFVTGGQAAGTYVSGPLANAGDAAAIEYLVHVTGFTGTTMSLVVSLNVSPSGLVGTWVPLAGSAATTMTGIGNTQGVGFPQAEFVQVQAVVGGTGTPMVTFAVAVMVVQP